MGVDKYNFYEKDNSGIHLNADIIKARLLYQLAARFRFYKDKDWTPNETLDLILKIRKAYLPEDIGIIRYNR